MKSLSLIAVLIGLVASPLSAMPAAGESACLAGTASSTGREPCTPCPRGSSQPRAGQKSCIPCRAGTFAERDGQRTCLPCPEGTRQLRRAAVACDPIPERCAPGSYSENGRAPCLLCPIGQAQARTGGQDCLVCPSGTTTTAAGQARCVAAGDATDHAIANAHEAAQETRVAGARAGDDGASSATAVRDPATMATAEGSDPRECPTGSYSLTGMQPCLPCPADLRCEHAGTSLATLQRLRDAPSAF